MIDVPIANPIRFRPLLGQTDVNFDNTFEDDFRAANRHIMPFAQYCAADDWYVQVVADYYAFDESGNCNIDVVESYGGSLVGFGTPTWVQVGDYHYYTYTIRPQNTGCFKLYVILVDTEVVQFESEWLHNPVGGITALRVANPDLYKLEWFNFENAFMCEFPESGFISQAYIEGRMTYGQPAGDVSIFDNQGEEVKLKEVVQRVMIFECDVPAYLHEVLTVALAHDNFFINDVGFVTSKKPTVQQIGNSNLFKFTAELKQVTVIGLNTHDTGFDCDNANSESIMNIQNLSKSASFTVPIPAGYLLHVVTVVYGSGTSSTIECGTSLGSDDLFTAVTVSSTLNSYTFVIHEDFRAAQTIYFTLTGSAVMDINCQLIKSTP